jgi:hypothetical protein
MNDNDMPHIDGGFTASELRLGMIAYEGFNAMHEIEEYAPWEDLAHFDRVRWVSVGAAVASFGDGIQLDHALAMIRSVPAELRDERAVVRAFYMEPGANRSRLTASDLLYLNLPKAE